MVVFNELFMGVPQRVSNIDTNTHKLLNNERRRLIFFLLLKRTQFFSAFGQFFGLFYGRLCDFK